MSTLDELQRSVERLNRAVERLSSGMGKYGFANVYNDDVQLLLSERAELLATVEKMRGELAYLRNVVGQTQSDICPVDPAEMKKAFAAIEARAALTTGEATTPNAGERG